MAIDIIFGIFLVIGLIRGFMRGLVLAVFSFIALFAGIVGAIKFSHVTAMYLQDAFNLSSRFLPLISFVATFALVIIAVHLLSRVIQKFVEMAQLGFINKLAGALLLASLYSLVASTLFWFADQGDLISDAAKSDSYVYNWVAPMAPFVLDNIVGLIPYFKDLTTALQKYFEQVTTP